MPTPDHNLLPIGPMYPTVPQFFANAIDTCPGDWEATGNLCGLCLFSSKHFTQHRDRWLDGLEAATGDIVWEEGWESQKIIEIGVRWMAETFPGILAEIPRQHLPTFIQGILGMVWSHNKIQAQRMASPVWIARMRSIRR